MSVGETNLNSISSPNKRAELKYRNVNTALKCSIGYTQPEVKKRELIPRKTKSATLRSVMEEKHKVGISSCYCNRLLVMKVDFRKSLVLQCDN